jgi:hypothetical protein
VPGIVVAGVAGVADVAAMVVVAAAAAAYHQPGVRVVLPSDMADEAFRPSAWLLESLHTSLQ